MSHPEETIAVMREYLRTSLAERRRSTATIRAEPSVAERLDTLLDDAPCGFVVFADDGTMRAANATLLDMLGYSRDGARWAATSSRCSRWAARIFYQTHLFPLLRLHGQRRGDLPAAARSGRDDVGALVNAVRRERDGEWRDRCVLLRIGSGRKFEDALLRAKKEAEEARELAGDSKAVGGACATRTPGGRAEHERSSASRSRRSSWRRRARSCARSTTS